MSSRTMKISTMTTLALAASSVLALHATPAGALEASGNNDSFSEETTDGGCGGVKFVDYGKPFGSKNDDYINIYDNCMDGWGVQAKAWVDDSYQGKAYNDHGSGWKRVWDPFPNVKSGQIVEIEVCLVDDGDEEYCSSAWNGPIDG